MKILQNDGKEILPVTHEKAVLDDNGVSLQSKIEELQANQLELVNVVLSGVEAQITEVDTKVGELENLQTEDKDNVIDAINELNTKYNELFQSANNGKELIADAIGEPLSSEQTFSAMSSDIDSLLGTFKTNMMNNGITVESSDKFKVLIDKLATLSDNEGKGIQFVSGVATDFIQKDHTYTTVNGDGETVEETFSAYDIELTLDFSPSLIYVHTNYTITAVGQVSSWESINVFDALELQALYLADIGQSGADVQKFPHFIEDNKYYIPICQFASSLMPVTACESNWYVIGVGEEDTTLRDSLASILQEEGVTVAEEDDMASLINKTDAEFEAKDTEYNDAKSELVNALVAKGLSADISESFTDLIAKIGRLYKMLVDAWTVKTTIPSSLCNHSATTVGNKVYIIGGSNGNTNYRYTPSTDSWETLNPAPIASSYHTAAYVNNLIYLFHFGTGAVTDVCYTYDPLLDSWSTITSSPTKRYSHTCGVVNNKVYIMGGYSGGSLAINSCYDVSTGTWSTSTAMPYGVFEHSSATIDNNIYVFGGTPDTDALASVLCFNVSTSTWTYKYDMPEAVEYSTSVALEGNAYVIGGYDKNTTYCFDPVDNSWSSAASLPDNLECSEAVVVDGLIYTFGGRHSILSSGCNITWCYGE